ncbi:hypothetical protein PF008_g24654 [Phytophthora fragariae]|uniref:Uncharacterized protein n=1 Tax=Phytophthora fragariae TaxID=53985 RepID=A0A6G0QME0_9STRA|nr:hypothetical protein PF008_g24654 [Phytophthora fragariae]
MWSGVRASSEASSLASTSALASNNSSTAYNELLWHHPASPHNEALSSPTTNTNIGPSQLVATSARV